LNLKPRDYNELEKDNTQYLKSCKFLLKEWNNGLEECLKESNNSKDSSDLSIKNVGKLNPKKHLEDT